MLLIPILISICSRFCLVAANTFSLDPTLSDSSLSVPPLHSNRVAAGQGALLAPFTLPLVLLLVEQIREESSQNNININIIINIARFVSVVVRVCQRCG